MILKYLGFIRVNLLKVFVTISTNIFSNQFMFLATFYIIFFFCIIVRSTDYKNILNNNAVECE